MDIEKVSWHQVEDKVHELDPDLCKVINDQLREDDSYKNDHLFKVRYNYGELVVDNGQFVLPKNASGGLNGEFNDELSYAPIPYFMVWGKNFERFINTCKRPIPFDLMTPGRIFGVCEAIDYVLDVKKSCNWSISAGSRTVILLPRIQNRLGYKRLANIYPDIMEYVPTNYTEQWNLFTHLARLANAHEHWQAEILVFPKHWLESDSSMNWSRLCQHMLKSAWHYVDAAMDELDSKVEWEGILDILLSRRITPDAYMSDIVRHLIQIAKCKMPGFRPVIDEQSIPLSTLEHIFVQIYRSKQYLPTFMHIAPIAVGKHKPLYYSVNYPTFLLGALEVPSARSLLSFLKQLSHIFQTLKCRSGGREQCEIKRFELYHYLIEHLSKPHVFQDSDSLPDSDDDFNIAKRKYPKLEFCDVGNFWRGSIKIVQEV